MERDSHEQQKKRKTIYAKTEETFIYGNCQRLFLYARILVLSAGSCGKPMFFNLLVSQSRVCVCVCTARMCACGHGWIPSSSFCVRMCNFATRKTQIIAHEMLFIQTSCSVTIPPLQRSAAAGETQQNKSQQEITDFFFAGDHLLERLPDDGIATCLQLLRCLLEG